jgi:choline-glycine betaine transporter
MWVLLQTAICVMVAAVIVVNLGLGKAIAEVTSKILQCPMCLAFWSVLLTLLYLKTDVVIAVLLSAFAAYLSNFVGIIILLLNKIYEQLWQKSNK